MTNLTFLLRRAIGGDRAAENEAFALIYPELKRIAARLASHESSAVPVSADSLVNDFYVDKFRAPAGLGATIEDRNHFFALASRAMAQVLIERARHRNAVKRIPVDHRFFDNPSTSLPVETLLSLEQALLRLEKLDPVAARVAQVRFILGCTIPHTAEVLGISVDTVADEWAFARHWLETQLR